jgi:hypothetical protein
MSRVVVLALTAMVIACSVETQSSGQAAKGEATPTPNPPKAAGDNPKAAGDNPKAEEPSKPTPPASGDLAKVSDDVALPLRKLLGKTPQEVEALLGEPLGKGRTRESCVRFVPERTWFECKWVWQRYADKTKTFAAVQVTYEDGKSADLAFEHLPGAGKFDLDQALKHVGLELPGEPKLNEPQPQTKVWRWFNDDARLVVNGNQYRVMLSVVGGTWESTKLDIILNNALTEEQKKKIKPVNAKSGKPADE